MVVVARKSSIEYWGTFLGAVAALATDARIVVRIKAASRERTGRIVDLHGERRGSAPLGQCKSAARTRQVGRRTLSRGRGRPPPSPPRGARSRSASRARGDRGHRVRAPRGCGSG